MTRDLKLDTLKGFLIILVVMGHIPLGNFSLEKTESIQYFSQWFYFFHMPLFLAISVLFIKTDYKWLLKRASLILVPYFFWFFYGHKRMLIENPIEFIGGVLMGNWSTLNSIIWFLPALFSLNLLFFIFYKSNQLVKYSLIILSIISFIFATQIVNYHYDIPFGFNVAVYLVLLTYLIQYIYNHKEKILKINYIYIFGALILSSMLLFLYEPTKTHTGWHNIIDLGQFSVATTILGYMSFLILNLSIFILFMKINSNKFLSLIGTYSFPIFLLHLIVLYKVSNFIKFNSSFLNIFFLIFCFALSILLPIIISKFLIKISEKFKYIGMTQ